LPARIGTALSIRFEERNTCRRCAALIQPPDGHPMQALLSVGKQAFNELSGCFHLKMKIGSKRFDFHAADAICRAAKVDAQLWN
jgi:hypothetical protein